VYTKITALPPNIPRQLALDMLHSHTEVIQLNPLVTGVRSIDAPRDAASDEFFSQWYEISEVITWGFGMKKKIAFKGVFHDQPWGLQSHVYAPMGVDLRNKYRIGGNQPGEPREARELGLDTPLDGLYLREDVEIICNVPLTTNFVKKETKAATAIMVDRLARKAELLDAGRLHAMFEDGKLKTAKPNTQPTYAERPLPSPSSAGCASTSLPGSPPLPSESIFPPPAPTDDQGFGRYHDVVARQTGQSRRASYVPHYQQTGYTGPEYTSAGAELPSVAEMPVEAPGSMYYPNQQTNGNLYPPPLKPQGQSFRSELPGDSIHATTPYSPPAAAAAAPIESSASGSPYKPYKLPSPQPSPRLPDRRLSSSSHRISNPDVPPQHPAAHRSSAQTADWQRGLGIASAEDRPVTTGNSTHSRQSSSHNAPDHQRFSQLSIDQTPVHMQAAGQQHTSGDVSRCPVCNVFEGDEAAVSHHVSRAHFA